jgi:hypothetical protein
MEYRSNPVNFGVFTVVLFVLILLVFAILQWLHVPVGSFLDWAIAGASFWWLLVVTTVPWNIHFAAKQVLDEGEQSQEKGIAVETKQLRYVQKIARRSLQIAIALHLLSALGFYLLAATGIGAIRYLSSGAALLLTGLRPAVRAYQYLATRLFNIGREFKYPREDIVELRDRVALLETATEDLENLLDGEQPNSLTANQHRALEALRHDLSRLASAHEDLRATNQADHDRLSREARNAIAQLSADSEFLDRVREIIRFFKNA